ncbi:citrate lyase acyl carrier protein [Aerococcaceae bacterium DSM 111020]|nr:citrate lyase acyl carrier protein [Aerococcaceae bacterium DSM 111020]
MNINKEAVAGTVESSDIMITIAPNNDETIAIDLQSSVEDQFGKQIRQVITETLEKLDIQQCKVTAVDQGALDCTIQARTLAAAYRASDAESVNWKELATWNA